MGDAHLDFSSDGKFTVRIWDGMDGCWTDVVAGVDAEAALATWLQKTAGGTRNVRFDEIDYYRIFPVDTRMVWDGGPGREMFRGGEDDEGE